MKKTLLAVAMLGCMMTTNAADMCQRLEYAELQSMTTKELMNEWSKNFSAMSKLRFGEEARRQQENCSAQCDRIMRIVKQRDKKKGAKG